MQTKAAAVPVPGSGEPFLLTLRRTEDGEVKFIWWFASVRLGEDKVEGTQTAVERFTSWFEDRGDREGCRACARDVSLGERESGKVGCLVW